MPPKQMYWWYGVAILPIHCAHWRRFCVYFQEKKLAINIVLPCLLSWLAESSGYYEFEISDSVIVASN